MPVNSQSSYYKDLISSWTLMMDCIEGEDAIKNNGETYLPKLSGQDNSDYEEYKERGTFYNATSRTIQGLSGAILRKPPTIKTTISQELLDAITTNGLPLVEVIRLVIDKQIGTGYLGVLVDMPLDGGNPYVAIYQAQDILNFQTTIINGASTLTMLALREVLRVPKADDPYEMEEKERIRILFLVDGIYQISLYEKLEKAKKEEWILVEPSFAPTILGKAIDFIPFVFFGALSNIPEPPKPPLLDLAKLNVKHWQITVDYYHGLHYCALPTPWATGFDSKAKLYIGPGKAWVSENENAKCGFLEFSGAGLAAVSKAVEELESKMAVLGARLLEEQKKVGETAETMERRQASDIVTLSTIAGSCESGMTKVLFFLSMMAGKEDANAEVKLNRDYIVSKLEPAMIAELVKALQVGAISQDTFLYNLKQGEILPEDTTIEDEKLKIEADNAGNIEKQMADLMKNTFANATNATLANATNATSNVFPIKKGIK